MKCLGSEVAGTSGNGVVGIREPEGQERRKRLAKRFFRHDTIVARRTFGHSVTEDDFEHAV